MIQRTRIVNEQGNPLAASVRFGSPIPFSGPFNVTDRNGYVLINPNTPYFEIGSDGYYPYKARTKDVPKVVVMKRLPRNKSNHG